MHPRNIALSVLVGILISSPGQIIATEVPVDTLQQGAIVEIGSVEGFLSKSDIHTWLFETDSPILVAFRVQADSFDVVLDVRRPGGVLLGRFNQGHSGDPESFGGVLEEPGSWKIVVQAASTGQSGAYSVELLRTRIPNEYEILTSRAMMLTNLRKYADAIPVLKDALASVDAPHPDSSSYLYFKYVLGFSLYKQWRYAEAEKEYLEILESKTRLLPPDDPSFAPSLSGLGQVYESQGQLSKAIPLLERLLKLLKANQSSSDRILSAILTLSQAYEALGRVDDATKLFLDRIAEMEESGASFEDIRFYYSQLTWFTESRSEQELIHLDILRKAEAAYHPQDQRMKWPIVQLAGHLMLQGRYAEAEKLYLRNYEIQLAAGDSVEISAAQTNIARLLVQTGKYHQAEKWYLEAKRFERPIVTMVDVFRYNGIVLGMAGLYGKLGRWDESERLFLQGRDIASTCAPCYLGAVIQDYGRALLEQGKTAEAAKLLVEADSVTQLQWGTNDDRVASTRFYLADVYQQMGRDEEAIALLDDLIRATSGEPLIQAYALRAKVGKRLGHPNAIQDLVVAINTVEEQRPNAGGGEDTRAGFFKRFGELYDTMVEWQLDKGDLPEAMSYTERSRGRAFLDQLAASELNLKEGIPSDVLESLEQRESGALAKRAEYQQRLTVAQSNRNLTDSERDDLVATMSDSLEAADFEYAKIYQELKALSPVWNSQLSGTGDFATPEAIRERLLKPGELMLLYQISEERGNLIVVGDDPGMEYFVPLVVDEAAAKALDLEEGPLTSAKLDQVVGGRTIAGLAISKGVYGSISDPFSGVEETIRGLNGLWRVLLPSQVWQIVQSASAVTVIPDGALNRMPFEALIIEPSADYASAKFWIDAGPEIRYAPSASVLLNIAQRSEKTSEMRYAVVSVADPIYELGSGAEPEQGETTLMADAGSSLSRFAGAGGVLDRLPGTAMESQRVEQAFGRTGSGAVKSLRQHDATEANVRSALPGARLIHFATHGLIDENVGGILASLALTPADEATPTSANDGFLQLHEIYDLSLDGAELAVLSACETNVGTAIEGEGVFAISRGFLTAGAQRVVATQWAVDDRSTAELIGRFFEEIAENGAGSTDYAADLAVAKKAIRDTGGWSHPFYWAPFILTGSQ